MNQWCEDRHDACASHSHQDRLGLEEESAQKGDRMEGQVVALVGVQPEGKIQELQTPAEVGQEEPKTVLEGQ